MSNLWQEIVDEVLSQHGYVLVIADTQPEAFGPFKSREEAGAFVDETVAGHDIDPANVYVLPLLHQ